MYEGNDALVRVLKNEMSTFPGTMMLPRQLSKETEDWKGADFNTDKE